MGMPVTPSGPSRAGPMLENAAQDSIAAVRQQTRFVVPPEYAPASLTPEDRAEAGKEGADLSRICRYCVGEHLFPTSIGCPRIAEATLASDGTVLSVRFWPGKKWAEGRVVFSEDLPEGDGDD
jgi:hypothetical protein